MKKKDKPKTLKKGLKDFLKAKSKSPGDRTNYADLSKVRVKKKNKPKNLFEERSAFFKK